MDRLTLDKLWTEAFEAYGGVVGDKPAAMRLRRYIEQSLSQEAVRDEALEDAARACSPIIRREQGWEEDNHVALLVEIQNAIRALKREPNAVGPEDGRKQGKYRLVYNKAMKKIDKVSNFDDLAVESFDPPGASDD